MKLISKLSLALGATAVVFISLPAHAIINGDDGRIEAYQASTSILKRISDSTVAIFRNDELILRDRSVLLKKGETHGEYLNLCSTERFTAQPRNAFCTGTLVGPDLILTAGHCVSDELAKDLRFCQKKMRFVFNYKMKADETSVEDLSSNDVYGCKDIVAFNLEMQNDKKYVDFALIKLNRPVTGHVPLAIDRSTLPIDVQLKLVLTGYPGGLPQKIALGGTIKSSLLNQPYYTANLDSMGGNSGSPVFDEASGLIVGVLSGKVFTKRSSGDMDFIASENLECLVENKKETQSTLGDVVTRISEVMPYLPEMKKE